MSLFIKVVGSSSPLRPPHSWGGETAEGGGRGFLSQYQTPVLAFTFELAPSVTALKRRTTSPMNGGGEELLTLLEMRRAA